MAEWKKDRFYAVLCLIWCAMMVGGCAGTKTTVQETVTTEYLLTTAGFQKWEVNQETPQRQALMNNIPKGKISTYERGGVVYHVYSDENAQNLYIGDEAAYQKYLSLAQGKRLCERMPGENTVQFWSCMDEYQQKGRK